MSNQAGDAFKSMLVKGQIAMVNSAGTGAADTFKMILMQPGFVFDKNIHNDYGSVQSMELPSGNGYTAGGQVLTGVSLDVDGTTGDVTIMWNNLQWNASGGSITTSGAIIFDDSTDTTNGDDFTDVVVSYKDGGGDITATDGTPIIISSIKEVLN